MKFPLLFVLAQIITISTIIIEDVLIVAPFENDLVLDQEHLHKYGVSFP